MKLTITQENFSRALTAVSKSLSAKVNLPILANVLLSATKSGLEVLATDLETATRVATPAKVTVEGRAAVPGRVLWEFISQIPGGEVSLEKLGEELVIGAKSLGARLATMPAEDFPSIPKIEHGTVIRLAPGDLTTAVLRVAFCAAADEGRPVLGGILCEASGSSFSMVATDGYRLAFQKIATGGKPIAATTRVIVPARAMVEVAKLVSESGQLSERDVELEIAQTLNQANFRIADVQFTTRLVEGSFPPWQKIIPEKFTTSAKIGREELVRVVRIASIFARDSGSIVKFTLSPKDSPGASVLKVASGNKQFGSNEADVEIELSGKGGEIAFNYRYLLEMLSSVESEDVNFEMIESLNPGKITIPGEPDYFYIVMPVRLQS